ncbi:MAG TPA: DUF58 domain-containing protein [Micromonosporaceae bacterium]
MTDPTEDREPSATHPLSWWPAPLATAAATAGMLALLAAIVLHRAELVIVACGPLALLATAPRHRAASTISVQVATQTVRLVEFDELVLTVRVSADRPLDHLAVRLVAGLPLTTAVESSGDVAIDSNHLHCQWRLRPARWGRWPIGTVEIAAYACGRLVHATVRVDAGAVAVYPHMVALPGLPRPTRLRALVGEHVAAAVGPGVEFAGARPYHNGDEARRVHARLSARRGQLFVTERHAERLADVVVVVDGFSDIGAPVRSTLDIAVRACASVAAAYLRVGDRAGAMLLGSGGVPRSVPLGLGRLQLARVVELLIRARDGISAVEPNLAPLPPQVLPPGALVLVASPLADQRVIDVLAGLRDRGATTILLDVLDPGILPAPSRRMDAVARRLWLLDREALLSRLADLGVAVLPAADLSTLAETLATMRVPRPRSGTARVPVGRG